MKKFLNAICMIAISSTASAQCNEQSSEVESKCGGSYCFSISIPLTGSPTVDATNYLITGGTRMRKPTIYELDLIVRAMLEEQCP